MLRGMKAAFGQGDLRMRLRRQKSSAVEDITAEWLAEFDRRIALLEAATANWEAETRGPAQCPAVAKLLSKSRTRSRSLCLGSAEPNAADLAWGQLCGLPAMKQ